MLCDCCLSKVINKLLQSDIQILEYLNNQNAIIPQCSISRSNIKNDTKLSPYICYTSLDRLECFGMVEKQSRVKANKYYITDSGKKVLNDIDTKIMG